MIMRALDADWDWTFGKGRNNYLRGRGAIAQSLKTRLQMFLGDCFFALNEGIDWFNLQGGKDVTALRLAIQATILNTNGVTGILSLTVNLPPDRVLTVFYEVSTNEGSVEGSFSLEDFLNA
jgi:hypothetical protein